MATLAGKLLTMGRVLAPFGVRGWCKVHSDTDPPDNLLDYSPWRLAPWRLEGSPRPVRVLDGRRHGKLLVACLEGCDDRDRAALLAGVEIQIPRDRLPPAGPDEIYWADLLGLRVETLDGVALGIVSHVFPTGANDVLVVRGERERLLPLLWERVIRELDLADGLLRVDWDADF